MATTTVNRSNWMSGVEDSTPIHQLSIPATHESCSWIGGGPTQCQWLGITEQLNRGVRFLDIRCVNGKGRGTDDFHIYHGTGDQIFYLSQVQDECVKFLTKHPDEMIFMNVQRANDPLATDRPEADFAPIFRTVIRPHHAYWKFPTWSAAADIPTLDDCRGHIVLIRAGWPGPGLEWGGYDFDGDSAATKDDYFYTQNGWTTTGHPTEQDKFAHVKWYLEMARDPSKGPDRIFLNFLSLAWGGSVGTAAEHINGWVADYMSTAASGTGRFGVLPQDFVGNTDDKPECLEDLIIRRNPFKAGCSLARPTSPFKIKLEKQDGSVGWMTEGDNSWGVWMPDDAGTPTADEPLVFERYSHEGTVYFRTPAGYYLYARKSDGQVGLYNWDSANAFHELNGRLVSDYNGKTLRLAADGVVLLCGSGERLKVDLVAA